MSASSWDEVSEKKKRKVISALMAKAKAFYKACQKHRELSARFGLRFLFDLMCKMVKSYGPEVPVYGDKLYWQQQGWLDGKRPF